MQEYETDAASDYRLNFRLQKACAEDVESLCKDACTREEGQVRFLVLFMHLFMHYALKVCAEDVESLCKDA